MPNVELEKLSSSPTVTRSRKKTVMKDSKSSVPSSVAAEMSLGSKQASFKLLVCSIKVVSDLSGSPPPTENQLTVSHILPSQSSVLHFLVAKIARCCHFFWRLTGSDNISPDAIFLRARQTVKSVALKQPVTAH